MDDLKAIIKQICAEKGISEDAVYETINSALAAAYRKDFGDKTQNVVAEYDLETGQTKVFDEKEVVEDLSKEEQEQLDRLKELREARKEALEAGETGIEKTDEELDLEETVRKFNPRTEIELKEAQAIDKKYQLGDFVRTELEIPGDFGRMAAQTAKQVIIQRLKEAERNVVYQNFKDREGEIIYGVVQKFEGRNVLIDLGHVTAILPPNEQIRSERYNLGDRIKIILLSVALTTKGPELIVSRAHPNFIKELFISEIPEISSGVLEIKGIAREAGSRAKIAVFTEDDSIDPIGSCIGQRGSRIQTIINELNGEKIDIIEFDDDPKKYISNALLPAKITSVELDEEEKTATITVPEDQLSLTIGRAGQNVRLAVKLTEWKLNIKDQESGKEINEEDFEGAKKEASDTEEKPEKEKKEKEVEKAEKTDAEPTEDK